MAPLMVLGVALRIGLTGDAVRTALLVTGLALLPVAGLMFRQVRSGAWGNVDASDRRERPLLYSVGIGALAVLLVIQLTLRPGSFLVRGMLGVLLLLGLCAVLTRWIKVSLHLAFGGLAATALLFLGSPVGWAVAAFLPLLAWSRLSLGRHQPVEVAIGLLVGAAFGYGITHF